MTLENLKKNLREEQEIVKEALFFYNRFYQASGKEREIISQTINSLLKTFKIINESMPELIENISVIRKLGKPLEEEREKKIEGLISLSYEKDEKKREVTIKEFDREKFIEELRLIDFSAKKMKREKEEEIAPQEFKKPSLYAKLSNRFFFGISSNLVKKGHFISLREDLRKANMPFIVNTYLSIIFFSTLVSLIFSLVLFLVLIFINLNLAPICLLIPFATFAALYFYPYTEKKSLGRKIDRELPFVVIHMSAIAGSGIEPTQIFKIIVLGREYPHMKQEIRKVMNQINFFGYDLVSALKNSAKLSSSNKLAELLRGIATTISSGGSLTEFFDKRAETLLLDYKLEREKATKMAESFMDIYISVVIAAPMILMLLLVLMSSGVVSIGLSVRSISIIIISIVALINVVFLAFLQLKQQ